jgi:hypothetical protein
MGPIKTQRGRPAVERLGRDALDRLTPLDLQRTKKDIEHQNGVGRIRRRPQDGMTLPILSQRVPKTDVSNRRFESIAAGKRRSLTPTISMPTAEFLASFRSLPQAAIS